jgi:type I restriction enzyme R subunit
MTDATQSEQALEKNLITQLVGMKYARILIRDEADLLINLKAQLEKHNGIMLTDKEFARVLNYLNKGGVYDRAKILRDRMHLQRDDGTSAYVQFFNDKEWCSNQFQVTNQITMVGNYKNRYDVTILINGLPLAQIELKRSGLALKEAFNQTIRYHRHSYDAGYGLFQYIQIFVISNGANTKYYANNRAKSFGFTSFWTDESNNKISDLSTFAQFFLDRCHLAKMIAKHVVMREDKTLVVLRPYQYYAVEAIIDKVRTSTTGGYIWHTTGSGKTLTSFKASQILVDMPDIYKVVFVVDRNDLDTQTIKEFNQFKEKSVDTTDNTGQLVEQFNDPSTKLIVTTIQKLNNAVSNERHQLKMDKHRDKRIVFIFDECHRSQFGQTHKKITSYFTRYQLFGFTGTPILAENAVGNTLGKRTTQDLFGECLHKYIITDAINDENVLKFSVEYVGRYKHKNSANEVDIEVEAVDVKELMESPQRLAAITDYILANHARKTHSRDFNAVFAVSSIDVLARYYELFKIRQAGREHKLKVATIFSYAANEDDKEADGLLNEDVQLDLFNRVNVHSRDKLESYIADYNVMFGTSYTTKDNKSFYNYYKDIAARVKNLDIDLLLVVNMFLTGFDSPALNTLYVDKNLRYHGLLQAYSRTNRILNEKKSQGNIVAFRNLKQATDKALELFANKDAEEKVFMHPYETYVAKFNSAVGTLRGVVLEPIAVDGLIGEEQKLQFVNSFRELMRLRNILVSFADFTFTDTTMDAQEFEDFKSKYLDLYLSIRNDHQKEKVSILDEVDFELELISRDEINVDYILRLLTRLISATKNEKDKLVQNIMNALSTEPTLHSKRELIEKFIKHNLPEITNSSDVEVAFQDFWTVEKAQAFERICKEEDINTSKLQKIIEVYLYSGRKPRGDDIVGTLKAQPRVLERPSIIDRVSRKLNDFINTFIEGV